MEKQEQLPTIKDAIKSEWPVLLLILTSLLLGLYFYPSLPAKIPSHWDFKGQVNGYASKEFAVLFFPAINLVLYLAFLVIPKIDPKKKNYPKFQGSYRMMRITMIIFLTITYLTSLFIGLGHNINMSLVIQLSLGLLWMVIGNYMATFRHNYFVGVRTPWTLASEEVWRKTHRMAGPLWVGAGLVTILGSFLGEFGIIIFIAAICAAAIVPMLYSYLVFRKLES